jgi:outer membrane protein assembly factor BamD (BamD/ComL family)
MPTPESAAAFARLVEARERLNQLSAELTKALESRGQSVAAAERYRELQQQWDDAFHVFEQATNEFYAAVQQMRDTRRQEPT